MIHGNNGAFMRLRLIKYRFYRTYSSNVSQILQKIAVKSGRIISEYSEMRTVTVTERRVLEEVCHGIVNRCTEPIHRQEFPARASAVAPC